MKARNTLILLLLVAAAFAWLWFVEKDRPTVSEAKDTSDRLAEVDRDKVNSVSIKNAENKIELRKDDKGNWSLEEPVKDRADSFAVTQLFTTIETLRHAAAIDPDASNADKNLVKESGVESPDVKVRFLGGDKPVEISLGRDAAVEGRIYARVEGNKTIYVIPGELKTQLSKKADEFRDRKLTDVAATQVQQMTIKSPAGEIELAKGKDNHWSIAKPLKARGDDAKINDLLAQVTNAKVDTFVGDASNLGNYGLAEPRGRVTFTAEGIEKPLELLIGGNPKDEKDKEKTWVKLSTRDSVVLVPKAVEALLETKPNDVRDRGLVRLQSDIVDRIILEPAGKERIVLARKGEGWVRKVGDTDAPINDAIATRLLADLQSTQVTNFVVDTAADVAQYGLDKPTVKVTVASFSSEGTPESPAGERPIASLLLGKVEGDNGYAKLEDEPFVVAIPKGFLESIPTDVAQLQPLTINTFKPEEITSLEVARDGQPAVSLTLDKEAWKLAKGEGTVNQVNVKSLINTLATLRAVRWTAGAAPEQGFEKPAATVTFTAKQADKDLPGKLTFGNATPDELRHAMADGKTGVFLVARPDYDAFALPLIDQPATPALPVPPTPAPAASVPAPVPAAPAVEAVTPPVQAPPVPAAPAPPGAPAPDAAPPAPLPDAAPAP